VPLLTAGLLGLLGLVLAVEAARGRLVDARAAAPGWGQAARVLGLLAVYVAGLAWLGYFEATLPFVALAMWLGGARSPLLVGAAAAGLALAVWLVLGALFGVPLPRGPWL
jgi:hypothetical protein